MFGIVVAIVLGIGIALGVEFLILQATTRTLALRRFRTLISLLAIFWCLTIVAKKCYLDGVYTNPDAVAHEGVARRMAEQVSSGNLENTLASFRFGNSAYRFLLGLFYTITDAPEITTYAINGALAFWGLLSLLEVICFHARCSRISVVWVLLVMASPSVVFWATTNMKEGPIFWGISMMLRFTLLHPRQIRPGDLILPSSGLLLVGMMRPHVAAAWFVAIALGDLLRRKNSQVLKFGMFAIVVGLVVVAQSPLASQYAPKIKETVAERGVLEGMNDFYQNQNHLGNSAIKYATGSPIPFVSGMILILARPLPTEVFNLFSVMAGLEYWLLTGLGLYGWLRNVKGHHFSRRINVTMICALFIFAFYFTYMYNMGLMVRQRLQVFPAVILLSAWPFVFSGAVVQHQRWQLIKRLQRLARLQQA